MDSMTEWKNMEIFFSYMALFQYSRLDLFKVGLPKSMKLNFDAINCNKTCQREHVSRFLQHLLLSLVPIAVFNNC